MLFIRLCKQAKITMIYKRRRKNSRRKQGHKQNLTLLKIIDIEKIIGIYFVENEQKKFKAHLTKNISSREQLHLQGIKVIYNDFKDLDFKFLPLTINDNIKRLVYQSFNANGKNTNNNYFKTEWQILKNIDSKSENGSSTENNNQSELFTENVQVPWPEFNNKLSNTLFDIKVELNNTIKIKYLKNI